MYREDLEGCEGQSGRGGRGRRPGDAVCSRAAVAGAHRVVEPRRKLPAPRHAAGRPGINQCHILRMTSPSFLPRPCNAMPPRMQGLLEAMPRGHGAMT